MTKAAQKLIDARITRAFGATCSNRLGRRSIADGADDVQLGADLLAFVEILQVWRSGSSCGT